ncbi:MAG TPA: GntR family transcriptional regulator [Alphaproteobacteria bacterium]|nr:GntR family transcriptional regulator [Alphaproteobacteria bacterium]
MTPKSAPARKARGAQATASLGDVSLGMPKLQRNTLNEEVYQQLKQALMTGRIAPGSTMTIRSLAASFGISPMPVREALRRLVAEHVLVLLPNRSVSLPIITPERFREITRIRTSLEGLAAEEAAPLIGAEEIRQMTAINDEMERPGATNKQDYLVRNREFHFHLYQSSRLPTLVKIIEALWLQIGPLLTIQQGEYRSQETLIQTHHRRLLKALKKRDAAEARDAIVSDIEDAAKIIAANL